nr:MAG TPA: hypothetical protein [Caudoviricetes sp.]
MIPPPTICDVMVGGALLYATHSTIFNQHSASVV